MAVDVFSVGALNKLLRTLKMPGSHIMDTYFPMIQREPNSEEIHFEKWNDKARITPLVSPLVEGKVVNDIGSQVESFRPAYAKDKRRWMPHRPLRRVAGEALGGSLSPQQRQNLLIRMTQEDQLRMLSRRWEVMCSELIRTGSVTVTGDEYPTQVVNFGRSASLTKTLAGAARWGESGVSPSANLDTWVNEVLEASGVVSTVVTMDPLAWGYFKDDTAVQRKLDTTQRTNMTITDDPAVQGAGSIEGQPKVNARFKGVLGDLEIWVYQDKYLNDSGVETKIMPDYTVIVGGPGAEGTRAFGAIQDEEAGYSAEDFFIKSWITKDPAIRWMLLQCAPLPVLYRPNGTLAATVR